jgi:hypothetical protein
VRRDDFTTVPIPLTSPSTPQPSSVCPQPPSPFPCCPCLYEEILEPWDPGSVDPSNPDEKTADDTLDRPVVPNSPSRAFCCGMRGAIDLSARGAVACPESTPNVLTEPNFHEYSTRIVVCASCGRWIASSALYVNVDLQPCPSALEEPGCPTNHSTPLTCAFHHYGYTDWDTGILNEASGIEPSSTQRRSR